MHGSSAKGNDSKIQNIGHVKARPYKTLVFLSLLSGKKRLRSLKLLDMNSFMVFLPEGAYP